VTATDWPGRDPRFWLVYELSSNDLRHRLRVKVGLHEDDLHVPSVTGLFPTADWHERETFDFYGIEFTGHPRLTRILLPEDWVGWPLRKDSPLGYEEVAFTHNTPGRTVPDPALKKLAPKKVRYRAH
jgi:NADH-quinone oxidoreductase subunit C